MHFLSLRFLFEIGLYLQENAGGALRKKEKEKRKKKQSAFHRKNATKKQIHLKAKQLLSLPPSLPLSLSLSLRVCWCSGRMPSRNSEAYERWAAACQAHATLQIERNVANLIKGFETARGAEILEAEAAAQTHGGVEEARRVLIRNVEELTRRKAIAEYMAAHPPPPKRLTKKQKRSRRFHSRRIVSTDDLKLARFAFYGSLVALPWISFLLPFYFLNILKRGQWMSQVVTYNDPPPDLSARGKRDFVQFVSYINSSLLSGAAWTVVFVVWVCIFQGAVSSASPATWALSLIVGNVDPSW